MPCSRLSSTGTTASLLQSSTFVSLFVTAVLEQQEDCALTVLGFWICGHLNVSFAGILGRILRICRPARRGYGRLPECTCHRESECTNCQPPMKSTKCARMLAFRLHVALTLRIVQESSEGENHTFKYGVTAMQGWRTEMVSCRRHIATAVAVPTDLS